jgi:hypothetical protein
MCAPAPHTPIDINYAVDSLEARLLRDIIPFHVAALDNETDVFQYINFLTFCLF